MQVELPKAETLTDTVDADDAAASVLLVLLERPHCSRRPHNWLLMDRLVIPYMHVY